MYIYREIADLESMSAAQGIEVRPVIIVAEQQEPGGQLIC